MSLPPDLKILCHLLSNTPIVQLPWITPVLLRNIVSCHSPLSAAALLPENHSSEASVLVHKLKTQISTLLYGKSPEGRFVAAALIKTVVETGGWEVLRGAEYWVRGLLSILGKTDTVATKRLCILALTKIYLMTHQHQSLVREITTPTLPSFVSSCIGLVSPKSSGRAIDASLSLTESVFDTFSMLVPHHPAIFRPSTNQIRGAVRPYLAPTLCDKRFVSSSLRSSARRLNILLYQTAAKNAGGEDWGNCIRELAKEIHGTVDLVYRSILEDWESVVGYVSQPVDVDQELSGGGKYENSLPTWTGIDAGLQRLVGLLELLEEHFRHQTPVAVTIPLGIIVDLLARILSVAAPIISNGNYGVVRANPRVGRNEREGLWCGLPELHGAAMNVYAVLADCLGPKFTSMALATLDQVLWVFPAGKHAEKFRAIVYRLLSKLLPLVGPSLSKTTVVAIVPVLQACVEDNQPYRGSVDASRKAAIGSATNYNHLLVKGGTQTIMPDSKSLEVTTAASQLLPMLFSHLPQQHLRQQYRADLERIAILSGNRNGMVASILSPVTKQNGTAFYSILPHLAQAFSADEAVELLLRPRGQPIRNPNMEIQDDSIHEEPRNENFMEDIILGIPNNGDEEHVSHSGSSQIDEMETQSEQPAELLNLWDQSAWNSEAKQSFSDNIGSTIVLQKSLEKLNGSSPAPAGPEKAKLGPNYTHPQFNEDGDDSDASVHLVMEMSGSESESEDEEEIVQ